MSAIRVNGQWKTPSIVYARVEGQWKIVGQSYSKVDGLWRQTTFAGPPTKPTMSYVSTGVFQISPYNPTLVYEAIFTTGSGGSATLNTSNGRYTLNGENSGFNVVARYATGAPSSLAGYMERKKYNFSCRDIFGTCCDTCCIEQHTCYCSGPDPNTGGCPAGCSPNGQCGCDGSPGRQCMCGSIGCKTTGPCNCRTCKVGETCDVLINEPNYINSGTEWYKVA